MPRILIEELEDSLVSFEDFLHLNLVIGLLQFGKFTGVGFGSHGLSLLIFRGSLPQAVLSLRSMEFVTYLECAWRWFFLLDLDWRKLVH